METNKDELALLQVRVESIEKRLCDLIEEIEADKIKFIWWDNKLESRIDLLGSELSFIKEKVAKQDEVLNSIKEDVIELGGVVGELLALVNNLELEA